CAGRAHKSRRARVQRGHASARRRDARCGAAEGHRSAGWPGRFRIAYAAPMQRSAAESALAHHSYPAGLTREGALAWFRAGRERTREIFAIASPDAYYERPIALRNPIVFYDGHL